MKPGVVPFVAKELHNKGKGQLLISVAAGLDTRRLQSMFGAEWRVVRAMPNTAVTVGEGATVFCLGAGAEHSDSLLVQQLFSSVGYCARVMEAQIGELAQWRVRGGLLVRNIFFSNRYLFYFMSRRKGLGGM